jgi:hypothetical protein
MNIKSKEGQQEKRAFEDATEEQQTITELVLSVVARRGLY